MWGEQLAKVISVLPSVIWALLAVFVLWLLRGTLVTTVSRLTAIEAFGLKLGLSGSQALNAAIELAHKQPEWNIEVPEADRRRVIDRAERERALLDGAEVLWVDDHPSNNRNETRMLRSFGVLVTFAASTEDALHTLLTGMEQNQPFQLIFSDISRDTPVPNMEAGVTMLSQLRQARFFQPVIFYIGSLNPDLGIPVGAFGITNRPDQLLHLTLDALARVRDIKR